MTRELPVQFRYEGAALVGEKRMELNVVPAFAVSVSPTIVIVPLEGGRRDRRRAAARSASPSRTTRRVRRRERSA